MSRSPALAAYLAASALAGPAARAILARRAARGREDPGRLTERLGIPAIARPEGPLVWLHGASVGEGMSMLPLIAAMRRARPRLGILVTTGTVTSAARLAVLLPRGAIHQFVPVDTRGAVRGFLGHWRPDLAVWIESEFWPRLMVETGRQGIPMLLVNARVSARSARGWARFPGMARRLIGLFQQIHAQDAETVARLVGLGGDPDKVRLSGNLKAAAEPPGADEAALADARAALGGRPVFLAASTHAPEEQVAATAHRLLRITHPDLLTIIAPRHPERGAAIAEALEAEGLRMAQRSRAPTDPWGADILLADTMGEMGLWFRLAPVSFVGGTIAAKGGHNPLEPAALGSAVLHGPSTENFAPAYATLAKAGGAIPVTDADDIAARARDLLAPGGGLSPAGETQVDAAKQTLAQLQPDVAGMAEQMLRLLDEATAAAAR